jgi:hypothetical protein
VTKTKQDQKDELIAEYRKWSLANKNVPQGLGAEKVLLLTEIITVKQYNWLNSFLARLYACQRIPTKWRITFTNIKDGRCVEIEVSNDRTEDAVFEAGCQLCSRFHDITATGVREHWRVSSTEILWD